MDKMKKLNTMRAILFGLGLGVLSMNITGCSTEQTQVEENLTDEMLKEIDEDLDNNVVLGFIKEGNEYFPVVLKDCPSLLETLNPFKELIPNPFNTKCYNLETNECIGDLNYHTYNDVGFYTIEKDNKIRYVMVQCLFFGECNPNVKVTTDMVKEFDDSTYKNLEAMYFDNKMYPGKYIKKYIIDYYVLTSLTPVETEEIIGFKISETEIFNFDTFQIENYENCTINEEIVLEEKDYCYDEILDPLYSELKLQK